MSWTYEKWVNDNDLIYDKIMDWNEKKMVRFIDLLNEDISA